MTSPGSANQGPTRRPRSVPPTNAGARTGKRVFDVVAGLCLSMIALPIIIGSAIGISISLRTNPFFIQDRVGRNGETFRIPKLRTLPAGTPRYANKYELRFSGSSRFAALLRRHHLDELPQLFLVPFGWMSLVGPRPEMAHLYPRMPERQGGTRLRLRPGCTGLWQISVAHESLIAEAPEYDIFYVEHHSWRLDLWIILRTALIMLGVRQPITLNDVPAWAYPTGVKGTASDRLSVQIERRRAPRSDHPDWLERVAHTAERTVGSEDETAASEAVS
jgi:lipopolysaccharide/colanic/teichoic acid biosynthesis glycosyltransferase